MNNLEQLKQAHKKLVGTGAGMVMGATIALLENQSVRDELAKDEGKKLDDLLQNLVVAVERIERRPSRLKVPLVDEYLAGLHQANRPAQATPALVQGFTFPPAPTAYSHQIGPDGEPIKDASGRAAVSVTRVGQLNLVAQALCTPELAAAVAGMILSGNPTPGQLEAIRAYFNSLMTAASGASASAANGAMWLAHMCPALADPALDEPWPLTYNGATLLGVPLITSAAPGGIALGAQATVVNFAFIANQEQQTVRSFRLKVTPTTAAGVLFSVYLPKPLKGRGAPKVHLQVENLAVVAVGSPYVSQVGGGENPYFQVATGTAPAAATPFNLTILVTQ